jgi:hypothetical protein
VRYLHLHHVSWVGVGTFSIPKSLEQAAGMGDRDRPVVSRVHEEYRDGRTYVLPCQLDRSGRRLGLTGRAAIDSNRCFTANLRNAADVRYKLRGDAWTAYELLQVYGRDEP